MVLHGPFGMRLGTPPHPVAESPTFLGSIRSEIVGIFEVGQQDAIDVGPFCAVLGIEENVVWFDI